MAPRVSVCLGVYNGEAFIERAIESVLAQTDVDFEFVISDNASTDRTVEIVRSFDDQRIRLLLSDVNRGMYDNFDRAVNAGVGEYVQQVCADDVLYPDCIARRAAVLVADDRVVLVGSLVDFIDEHDHVFARGRGPRWLRGRIPGRRARDAHLAFGRALFGPPVAFMFRRRAFDAVGGFSRTWSKAMDLDLCLRLSAVGDAYVVRESEAAFRFHQTSTSVEQTAALADVTRARLRATRDEGASRLLVAWSGAVTTVGAFAYERLLRRGLAASNVRTTAE